MRLILIGIQGAGKSTQGNYLSERYNIPYLSSGHIFREMAREKTQLGRWLKETINSGALVPDDTVLEVVLTYLEKPEYANGYILDGFPRTVTQASAFNGGVDKVIYIEVSQKEALWRISGREEERDDETLKAIRKRIELFYEVTKPVLGFYEEQDKLITINGEQPIEKVSADIVAALDEHFGKK